MESAVSVRGVARIFRLSQYSEARTSGEEERWLIAIGQGWRDGCAIGYPFFIFLQLSGWPFSPHEWLAMYYPLGNLSAEHCCIKEV